MEAGPVGITAETLMNLSLMELGEEKQSQDKYRAGPSCLISRNYGYCVLLNHLEIFFLFFFFTVLASVLGNRRAWVFYVMPSHFFFSNDR